MNIPGLGWSTSNEFQFLFGMGTHSKHGVNRKQALRGYIDAAQRRRHWGAMDPDQVVAYARKLLEECR